MRSRDDGRFDVATSTGTRFIAKAVVVAGGVGSFQPRRLKVDGLDRFRGTQLFEHAATLHEHAGQRVVIVGDSEAAVAAAIAVGRGRRGRAASVTLVHRRDDFDAAQRRAPASARCARRAASSSSPASRAASRSDGSLARSPCLGSDGVARPCRSTSLFVLLGWSPKLGPIADWGLALEKKQLVVDTERFETSTPGIFAVGDVNTYPGQAEADRLRLPRGDARRVRDRRAGPPGRRSRCSTRRRARSCTSCSASRDAGQAALAPASAIIATAARPCGIR